MTKKQRAAKAVEKLEQRYPEARCSLEYKTPFQLLIATRLSAQCTDARVNIVTPALFDAFPTAQEMGEADVREIEKYIKSCGLYKTKAKDLKGIGQMITDVYAGQVPDTIEELIKLPGVGRKTANLVCGDIYGKPAIVTDTHFIRIMNRLGLVNTKDALKVEKEMRALLEPEKSNDFCHRTVLFGREICSAQSPKCSLCELNEICKRQGVEK